MRRQWGDEEAAEIRRRYEAMERPSTRRLAQEAGRCPNTISAMVRAAGGTLVARGGSYKVWVWTDEEAEALKAECLAEDKPPIATLTIRHSLPEKRVYAMLRAANTPMRAAARKRTRLTGEKRSHAGEEVMD